MTPTPQTSTADFFKALWPEEPLPGSLVIWRVGADSGIKTSTWCNSLAEAANAARRYRDSSNVYFGVALQDSNKALAIARQEKPSAQLSGVRGRSESTVAIPGFWVDIDIQAPVHKNPSLPPDAAAARSLLGAIPQESTIVVDSGYGLHVYWLFHEPWVFSSDEDRNHAGRLLTRLQSTLRDEAARHGWHLDPTADLARVLRVPGTFNHKAKT